MLDHAPEKAYEIVPREKLYWCTGCQRIYHASEEHVSSVRKCSEVRGWKNGTICSGRWSPSWTRSYGTVFTAGKTTQSALLPQVKEIKKIWGLGEHGAR